jgi:hypothetical protein
MPIPKVPPFKHGDKVKYIGVYSDEHVRRGDWYQHIIDGTSKRTLFAAAEVWIANLAQTSANTLKLQRSQVAVRCSDAASIVDEEFPLSVLPHQFNE